MLTILVNLLIVIIAFMHAWFLVLEMFLWQKPIGLKTFRLTAEFAKQSANLAANQGLYNGFLAAGLIWSLFSSDPLEAPHLKIFFLICVAIAGIYGALSVNRKIFFVQGLPALIALGLMFLDRIA